MRHTILLADDSPTIQRLVNQTFADTRFDIVTVNNGDAAVRTFDEIEPDVVLADIYMPGKNGYEVCAHVKEHASLSGTPVILLVGAFDAFDEATATQAGATSHIKKPFEPRALVELVASTLPEGAKPRKAAARTEPQIEEPAVAAPEPPAETIVAAVVDETAVVVAIPAAAVEETPAVIATPAPIALPAAVPVLPARSDSGDLLGLENLFPPEAPRVSAQLSESEIDRIADRVIQKLSSQVVESIAWDVVPDIAAKILRDGLKKTNS